MRKSIKFFSLLAALLVVAGFQSCKKDKGDLLNYVPADASVVVYGDFRYVMEQLGYKEDGKIGEPLKSALDKQGIDYSENKEEIALINEFTREAVMFMDGKKLWIIAGMNDTKKFIDYLKDEEDFDVEKEDGVEVLTKQKGSLMFKDNMLFVCYDLNKGLPVDNTSGVNDLCKLGGDSFANADGTKEIAARILDNDNTLFALANLGKLSNLVDTRDFDQFRTSLSMIYNNPTYIAADLKVADNGMFASVKVLDKNYAPAKCSLPLGSIDTSAFSYAAVPDNTSLIALALPTQLVNQIAKAASNALPRETLAILKLINGTLAITINPIAPQMADKFAVMITGNNESDAQELGKFLQQNERSLKCSTSGKYLRITMSGASKPSGSTAYADIIKGKAAGAVCDLSAFAKGAGLSGDLSKLGLLAIYADTADGSLSLKAEWKCEKPIERIFDLVNNAETIMNNVDFGFASDDSYYYDPYDSIAYDYDDYVVEEVVEPDYLY